MGIRLSDIVVPGDKLDMRTAVSEKEGQEGDAQEVLKSSVCDVISETLLEIVMPTRGGRTAMLHAGLRCEMIFYTKRGMYRCFGEVKSRRKAEHVPVLAVELAGRPVKFQRRDYFRVDCLAEIRYCEIDRETAGLPTAELLRERIGAGAFEGKGMLRDISGGGARFTSPVRHEKGSFLLLQTRLSNACVDETLYLVGQVMECGDFAGQKGTCVIRVKFLFKDLRDRERIVKFVFEEDRKIRRKVFG